MPDRRLNRRHPAFCLLAGALCLSACAPDPTLQSGTLTPSDFLATAAPTAAETPADDTEPAAPVADESGPSSREIAWDDLPEAPPDAEATPRVFVLAGDPELEEGTPAEPAGAPLAVGALIGQINGRPIYVEEVLDPVAARLRAAARSVREGTEVRSHFDEEAAAAITRRLRDIVSNEIYLSEAETAIPDEQRLQALDYYKQVLRNETVSEQGQGSVEAAERWARQEHNLTLDEYVDSELRRVLIGLQVREQVYSRVIVSWHEIERSYREQHERFHPQPFARFRVFIIPASRTENRQAIESALAEGATLQDLYELGEIRAVRFREQAGLFEVRLESEDLSALTLFEQAVDAPLNEAARLLEVGEVSPAIEFNQGLLVGWVQLEALEAPPAVSLYEAQQQLRAEILEAKRMREFGRFEETFLTRQDINNMRTMAEMTLNIARRQYLSP
ncbi:MAG: hypothetical protein ACF8NJ_09850 [Phycisphaerales bacterium JB038]